ncbi:single-stranded DNA-binding protein, partial [bacterium]|nr:single-stranded DNA-binding protein [bacterium]
MEFTGTITSDAIVSTVKGDKEVVNFSVAINDRYKPKNAPEVKEFTTYINVVWWMGKGIAKILNKGAIVTISGRLFATAYNDMSGNAKASINCHADSIKLI